MQSSRLFNEIRREVSCYLFADLEGNITIKIKHTFPLCHLVCIIRRKCHGCNIHFLLQWLRVYKSDMVTQNPIKLPYDITKKMSVSYHLKLNMVKHVITVTFFKLLHERLPKQTEVKINFVRWPPP